jgi:hypothetical protein
MPFPVIISYSNFGYELFAKNMLISLDRETRHHAVHFYCLDNEIYDSLRQMSFQNIHISFELYNKTDVSKNFEQYGTAAYNSITHTKMNILRDALTKFDFIHFIDCDVVCMKEPMSEHYAKYAQYDIVFQHDAGMHSENSLHAPTLHHIWCCTGNTSFRNTPGTQLLLDKISEYQMKYPGKNDQECLYQFFQDISLVDLRDFQDSKLYTYEVNEYTNGYWVSRDIGPLTSTYFFHANHVQGSTAKFDLLKKAGSLFVNLPSQPRVSTKEDRILSNSFLSKLKNALI